MRTDDISTKEGCENLIISASSLGCIGGIFNLAASLQDAAFENQTAEKFTKSVRPKALATKHLDEISRRLCPHLDFFVVFSSVSCGRGSSGQTNYGLSNSITERIIEKRCADKLPGKAIQWGPISGVGMLETLSSTAVLRLYGYRAQDIKSCFEILDKVLLRPEPIFSSLICESKQKDSSKGSGNVFERLVKSLGVTAETVDENAQLATLGLDSISGVEFQQILSGELGIVLTLKEIRSKSINELKEMAKNQEKTAK